MTTGSEYFLGERVLLFFLALAVYEHDEQQVVVVGLMRRQTTIEREEEAHCDLVKVRIQYELVA